MKGLRTISLGDGEAVRDWLCQSDSKILWPSDECGNRLNIDVIRTHLNFLWPYRETLKHRKAFGVPVEEKGIPWWALREVYIDKVKTPLSITFAEVSTHNHFALERGGKVFKQTAPVIKLAAGATEDDHLEMLGLLNSSAACFWLKQVCFPKGGDHVGTEGARIRKTLWDERYAFNASNVTDLPVPKAFPLHLAGKIDQLADKLSDLSPLADLRGDIEDWLHTLHLLIALQEELDWQCYELYGLVEEDMDYTSSPPKIELGQRAFEIVMARQVQAGKLETTWFDRHNSIPITEIPAHWPDDYKQLVERRIQLIETDKNIGLIEQPEYKRRWNTESWDSQLQRALETWLIDRLESYFDFDGRMNDEGTPTAKITDPTLISTAKLADIVRQDTDFFQVGEFYRSDPAFNVQKLIDALVDKQTVPLLPTLRYKPSGFRKRADWEHTWQLQRQEDAIDARSQLPHEDPNYLDPTAAKRLKEADIGPIPVPPKYTTKDFAKTHYWKLRGKLDVPKERWVSFPNCEGPDGFPVIAWAGYNHLQLAQAISTYYVDVQENFGGRDDPRLVPLLGCLLELLPWLKQWHNDLDPTFNEKMGDFYEGFIEEEARQMGLTLEDIRAWEPPKTSKKGKGRKKR
ncbi:MAG: BREX-2 system adenine-specific DNA-methyltransferase PglX [Cyanobacteria bacterium J06626_18]